MFDRPIDGRRHRGGTRGPGIDEYLAQQQVEAPGRARRGAPSGSATKPPGGARSAVWRQIMADVYGCPVQSLNFLEEATSMGAAVIGGVAAGLFADFEVIHKFVSVDRTAVPNAENREVYSRLMPVFEKTYRSLVEVFDDLAKLN